MSEGPDPAIGYMFIVMLAILFESAFYLRDIEPILLPFANFCLLTFTHGIMLINEFCFREKLESRIWNYRKIPVKTPLTFKFAIIGNKAYIFFTYISLLLVLLLVSLL